MVITGSSNDTAGLAIMVNGSRRPFDHVMVDCDGGGHILVLGFGGAKEKKKKKKSKKGLVVIEHGTHSMKHGTFRSRNTET